MPGSRQWAIIVSPSGITVKQKRPDPLDRDAYCDSDDGIDKAQQRLQPGIPSIHGHNHHHDSGGYTRRDNVFTLAQYHHDQGADTEQSGHAHSLKWKDT